MQISTKYSGTENICPNVRIPSMPRHSFSGGLKLGITPSQGLLMGNICNSSAWSHTSSCNTAIVSPSKYNPVGNKVLNPKEDCPERTRSTTSERTRSDTFKSTKENNSDKVTNSVKRKNVKILVVGNAKCGKSSLISKYAFGTFDDGYKTTVGADFVRKDVIHPAENEAGGMKVRLQLWDIAGQDRFQKLTRAYFSNARGVIIVCDLKRAGTIEAVRQWRAEVREWAVGAGRASLPVVLFANKADTMEDPADAVRMGGAIEKLCREEDILGWFITSARTGESVAEGFATLLDGILLRERADSECIDTTFAEASPTKPLLTGASDQQIIRLVPSSSFRTESEGSCC